MSKKKRNFNKILNKRKFKIPFKLLSKISKKTYKKKKNIRNKIYPKWNSFT